MEPTRDSQLRYAISAHRQPGRDGTIMVSAFTHRTDDPTGLSVQLHLDEQDARALLDELQRALTPLPEPEPEVAPDTTLAATTGEAGLAVDWANGPGTLRDRLGEALAKYAPQAAAS